MRWQNQHHHWPFDRAKRSRVDRSIDPDHLQPSMGLAPPCHTQVEPGLIAVAGPKRSAQLPGRASLHLSTPDFHVLSSRPTSPQRLAQPQPTSFRHLAVRPPSSTFSSTTISHLCNHFPNSPNHLHQLLNRKPPLFSAMPPHQPQHAASNAEGQPDLNPNDETADPGAYLFAEPDLESFSPIVSGMHLWASHRQNAANAPPAGPGTLPAPLVPWDDLPFPRSDRAKLAPSTIRWQFTGRFNLNCEEAVAQGSICIQVKRWLEHKGFPNPSFTVNFPRGAGRGRFVDVNVDHCQMVALADMPLVF